MERTYDEIRDSENNAVVTKGVRGRQRNNERGCHSPEHGEADDALLGIKRIRQPRVRSPRPPQSPEEQHSSEKSIPCGVVRNKRRDLSDCEDDDEIEKQLQRSNPLRRSVSIGHSRDTALRGPCERRRQ